MQEPSARPLTTGGQQLLKVQVYTTSVFEPRPCSRTRCLSAFIQQTIKFVSSIFVHYVHASTVLSASVMKDSGGWRKGFKIVRKLSGKPPDGQQNLSGGCCVPAQRLAFSCFAFPLWHSDTGPPRSQKLPAGVRVPSPIGELYTTPQLRPPQRRRLTHFTKSKVYSPGQHSLTPVNLRLQAWTLLPRRAWGIVESSRSQFAFLRPCNVHFGDHWQYHASSSNSLRRYVS